MNKGTEAVVCRNEVEERVPPHLVSSSLTFIALQIVYLYLLDGNIISLILRGFQLVHFGIYWHNIIIFVMTHKRKNLSPLDDSSNFCDKEAAMQLLSNDWHNV